MEAITFVVPVNDWQVCERNLLASPLFHGDHPYQILTQVGFSSAARAYNDGLEQAENDLVVFAHQDAWFPESWMDDLRSALAYLALADPAWGVLGCFGVAQDGTPHGYLYDTAQKRVLGGPLEFPAQVETLDEVVLILRKSSGLSFDDALPHFHFQGTDICMGARESGRRCYAISAFCIHNTLGYLFLPREFYSAYLYVRRRWRRHLPIRTSCITIVNTVSKPLLQRVFRDTYRRVLKPAAETEARREDPAEVFRELRKVSPELSRG